ncbi:hypothetical protein [Rivibacter subsaxonicus]|uniref:Uncharacterized protein n=1 Tax=Rivibacter subsaxonicus TaxID=457575 RepID=A0A4Q7VNE5_9BURK|nr:hypothetical protein [Rivibacter subsaxonicus]RZT97829.1 hypothetical protein EV670_2229 [Rivibacter subsaxonicus]
MSPRPWWLPPPLSIAPQVRRRIGWAGVASLLLPWLAGAWFKLGMQPGLHPDPERAALMVDILVIATIVFLLTMVFTVAIGCWVVAVMKGPRYSSDPFPDPEIR